MNRILIALPLLATTTGCVEIPLAILIGNALVEDANDSRTDDDGYGYYDEYADYSAYNDYGSVDEVAHQPIEGLMAGRMAANGNFEREITRGEVAYYDDGSMYLEAHALGEAWAMFGVTLDLDALERGVTHSFGADDLVGIGCSGVREYEYAFDGPALQTDVTVDDVDAEGTMRVTIWADFGNGDEVTTVAVVPAPDAE